MTHNQKKDQTSETDPEIREMLELAEKDIKIIVTMILMFKRERKI